jgi:lysozyme family protein
MGNTLATYQQWSDDSEIGTTQVQDMTERTARAIDRSLYWNPLRADALPAGVDLSVFDMGVNAGIWRSPRLLQRALGFTGEPEGARAIRSRANTQCVLTYFVIICVL